MATPKIKLPMYAVRLAHSSKDGGYIPEEIYRVPLVFKNLEMAKDIYETTAKEMKDTVIHSIRISGYYVPEDGRVMAAKKMEVFYNEEICSVEASR